VCRRAARRMQDAAAVSAAGAAAESPASVTLKCLPHEKCARGEKITELICIIKILPAPLPPEKFPPVGRRAGQIFTGKLSAGGDFSKG